MAINKKIKDFLKKEVIDKKPPEGWSEEGAKSKVNTGIQRDAGGIRWIDTTAYNGMNASTYSREYIPRYPSYSTNDGIIGQIDTVFPKIDMQDIPRGSGLDTYLSGLESVSESPEQDPRSLNLLDNYIKEAAKKYSGYMKKEESKRPMMFFGSGGVKTMKPKKAIVIDKHAVVSIKGADYLVSDCALVDGFGWMLKSNPNLLTDPVTGEIYHQENAYRVYASLLVDEKSSKFKRTEMSVSRNTYDMCVPFFSEKHGLDGKVISLDVISGWDYIEDPTRNMIIDNHGAEYAISGIAHYDSYKNKCASILSMRGRDGSTSQTHLITEGLKYTFGVEIEVNRGNIPIWMAAQKFNMSCIRDGSINGGAGGPEYVTGVLVGDSGIKHLQEICLALSKRTTVDASCGIHLHLGAIKFDSKFIINSYRLAMLLQDEIFTTLPKSRRSNTFCRKLKPFNLRPAIGGSIESDIAIEEDYNQLFKYIAYEKAVNPNFDYNKKTQHPMGAKCGYNHDTPRYCWLNFVPAMFDTRGNGSYSIEIRCHGATTNFVKIKNWLLFFMAFMAFVEKYPDLIQTGITMRDVIDRIMPRKSKHLNMYFNERKELFQNDKNEVTEYKSEADQQVKNIKELIVE